MLSRQSKRLPGCVTITSVTTTRRLTLKLVSGCCTAMLRGLSCRAILSRLVPYFSISPMKTRKFPQKRESNTPHRRLCCYRRRTRRVVASGASDRCLRAAAAAAAAAAVVEADHIRDSVTAIDAAPAHSDDTKVVQHGAKKSQEGNRHQTDRDATPFDVEPSHPRLTPGEWPAPRYIRALFTPRFRLSAPRPRSLDLPRLSPCREQRLSPCQRQLLERMHPGESSLQAASTENSCRACAVPRAAAQVANCNPEGSGRRRGGGAAAAAAAAG
eukprot:SAG31_NODE_11569_length_1017_cov_0.889978_1_plen_270_part_10